MRLPPPAGPALASLALALLVSAAPPAPPLRLPPVTLVETRPVETALGNPDLPESLPVWLDLVRRARTRLDIEQFYCSDWPGEPLRPVLDEIGRAAARGVRVRLLLDRRMSATYPMPADSLGRLAGIEVRRIDMGKIAGGVQHAKFWIADGRVTFLGSQNLDWRALKHIHELGVRFDDERITRTFAEVFELDWAAADTSEDGRAALAARRATLGGPSGPAPPLAIVQSRGDTVRAWPLADPRGFLPDSSRWDLPALARLLDSARRSIGIQLLSYSPQGRGLRDTTLDLALRRAAARGVRVRMVVSDWVMGRELVGALRDLARAGVDVRLSTLPEWSGGYIPFARVEHCKYAVVDGERLWVGTANWEPSYFHGTRNLAAVIENRRLAGQLERVFETSWNAPSAAPLRLEGEYPEKIRGEEPPPGHRKYGG